MHFMLEFLHMCLWSCVSVVYQHTHSLSPTRIHTQTFTHIHIRTLICMCALASVHAVSTDFSASAQAAFSQRQRAADTRPQPLQGALELMVNAHVCLVVRERGGERAKAGHVPNQNHHVAARDMLCDAMHLFVLGCVGVGTRTHAGTHSHL